MSKQGNQSLEEMLRRKRSTAAAKPAAVPGVQVRLIDKLRLAKALREVWKRKHTIPMKSWRTSIFGVGGLFAVWSPVIMAALDGDPATVPAIGTAVTLSLPAIGLLFARDNKVTSEQAKAK